MSEMMAPRSRSAALIGPYGSGKTTLFEALLSAAGTPPKRASTRERTASTSLALGGAEFLGETWSLLDCPGSIEFFHETEAALKIVDFAVLVVDPDPARARAVFPYLRTLALSGTPYLVFINRIDTLTGRVQDTLAALQALALAKLVLREVPIREGERITGYVDVVSERAYRYRPGEASELIALPATIAAREREARAGLLETLADHDDALLEKLLEDIEPTTEEVFHQLSRGEAMGAIAEVLFGAADRRQGVRRLWKALRHDAPDPALTARRHGIAAGDAPLAQVFKTLHAGHAGKLSYARIWRGVVREGMSLNGTRLGGIQRPLGEELQKIAEAGAGALVALGRLEGAPTGAVLTANGGTAETLPWPAPPAPVHALAIAPEERKDEVKLSGALQKIAEEDPALTIEHNPETGETVLHGQGEIHLNAALERLAKAYGLRLVTRRPMVAFKETIRRAVREHARFKRQTGGHGQFADVTLEIEPRGRGEGFLFVDRITGGVVPRQFIPAVGEAAAATLAKGVFGFPVVDIAVTLVDGGFHTVDSSDLAFKTATRMAIQEALAKADPVLLEPIDHLAIALPNDVTASAQRLISSRRGRILGYAEKPGWPGWDEVEALLPEAELHGLIIELRSQTMGLGTYRRHFDHLAEAPSAIAEKFAAPAGR
jgi:elongation factor G